MYMEVLLQGGTSFFCSAIRCHLVTIVHFHHSFLSVGISWPFNFIRSFTTSPAYVKGCNLIPSAFHNYGNQVHDKSNSQLYPISNSITFDHKLTGSSSVILIIFGIRKWGIGHMQETVSIKQKVYPNDYRCVSCILNYEGFTCYENKQTFWNINYKVLKSFLCGLGLGFFYTVQGWSISRENRLAYLI